MNKRWRFGFDNKSTYDQLHALGKNLEFTFRMKSERLSNTEILAQCPGDAEVGLSPNGIVLKTVTGVRFFKDRIEFWGSTITDVQIHGLVYTKRGYGWFELDQKPKRRSRKK